VQHRIETVLPGKVTEFNRQWHGINDQKMLGEPRQSVAQLANAEFSIFGKRQSLINVVIASACEAAIIAVATPSRTARRDNRESAAKCRALRCLKT
jgi:hypothetical protein